MNIYPLSVCRRVRSCLAFWILIAAATGEGQSAPAPSEGIPVGRWIFHPALQLIWQSEDNLFLTQQDPQAASSYYLRPSLVWDLPFRESDLKLSYTPEVHEFVGGEGAKEEGFDRKFYSHFIGLDSKLVFSTGFRLKVRDEFIIDTFETSRFDSGGEAVFNNNEYRRNEAEIEALKDLGPRHGLGIALYQEGLKFEEQDVQIYTNYDRLGGALVYVWKLTPLSQVRASIGAGSGGQDGPPFQGFEEQRNYSRQETRLTYQAPTGRQGSLEVGLGLVQWDFEDAALADFNGVLWDARHRIQFGGHLRLHTTLSRAVLPSFYNTNSLYTTDSLNVRFTREGESPLYYTGSVGFRRNEYPEELRDSFGNVIGPRRKDDLVRAEVGVGYRFTQTLRVEARYRHDERSSNVEGVEYSSNRLTFQLSLGWL